MTVKQILDLFSGTHLRIAVGMGAIKCVRAVLTIASVTISAGYFGASLERDAWVLGCSAVTLSTQLLFGPLNETFRIKYLHILAAEGEAQAQHSVAALLKWVVAISGCLVLGTVIYPDLLIHFLAPGFAVSQQAFVARVLVAYFPILIFAELIVLFSSVLNAYRSYYLPEFFAIASVTVSIVAMVLTAKHIGIYSLVVATYLSHGVLLMVLIHALRKRDVDLWPAGLVSWKTVSPYFWFGMPLYLSYLTNQFLAVIERRVCTLLGEGSVSILDYGRKFMELPMSILLGVAASVVAPMLARQVSDKNQFAASTFKFILLFYLGLIPFCAMLIIFPSELVQVLLLHGSFKPEYGPATAEVVRWSGVGALGLPLSVVCSCALLASQRRRLYIVTCTSGMLLSAAINLLAYRRWGVATLAMSWSLYSLVTGGIMLMGLPELRKRGLFGLILPLLLMAAIVVAVSLLVRSSWGILRRLVPESWPPAFVELALACGCAFMVLAFCVPFYRRRIQNL